VRAQPDNRWECQWAVSGQPAAEGGSGYIIVFHVGNDGAIASGSISCNAPG
jgi:hypothetical protein